MIAARASSRRPSPDNIAPRLLNDEARSGKNLASVGVPAKAAIDEAVDIYRQLAAARPEAFRPDLAMSLNNLSIWLAELGRREDALAAITEAVDAYRELAARWPDVYQDQDELQGSLDLLHQLEER